jgi:mannose-6-phosphate isomerase-like protein (cupin superfamily)
MDSTTHPSTLELGRHTVLHLGDDLSATAVAITPAFWTHEGDHSPALTEGRIVCVSDYDTTWTWWERHPVGDEVAYLISGDADFVLDDGSGPRTETLTPGRAVIVPEGDWHRAVLRAPSRILFVTPTPARTELREIGAEAAPVLTA